MTKQELIDLHERICNELPKRVYKDVTNNFPMAFWLMNAVRVGWVPFEALSPRAMEDLEKIKDMT